MVRSNDHPLGAEHHVPLAASVVSQAFRRAKRRSPMGRPLPHCTHVAMETSGMYCPPAYSILKQLGQEEPAEATGATCLTGFAIQGPPRHGPRGRSEDRDPAPREAVLVPGYVRLRADQLYFRVGLKIPGRRSEFDAWVERWRDEPSPRLLQRQFAELSRSRTKIRPNISDL